MFEDKNNIKNGLIEYPDGKRWYFNGKWHREDGPAIEYKNGKAWYVNGLLHRLDGAAIECIDGRKRWYVYGKEYFSFKELLCHIINQC